MRQNRVVLANVATPFDAPYSPMLFDPAFGQAFGTWGPASNVRTSSRMAAQRARPSGSLREGMHPSRFRGLRLPCFSVPIGRVAGLAQPILIVEDNTATRAGLASLLNFSGYTTVTARNAEEGLDFLRRGGLACLIILDLGLPGMDGSAFRAALLADPALADIPVIVYSGQDGSAVPRVFGHVNKTADPDVLLGMVAKVCDKGPVAESE